MEMHAVVRRSQRAVPDVRLLIIHFKSIALLLAAVSANWRDIQHAIPELNEGATLDGDVQVGDVV